MCCRRTRTASPGGLLFRLQGVGLLGGLPFLFLPQPSLIYTTRCPYGHVTRHRALDRSERSCTLNTLGIQPIPATFRQSVGADIIFTKGLYHMAWGILMTGFTLVGMVFLLVSNVAASNRPA